MKNKKQVRNYKSLIIAITLLLLSLFNIYTYSSPVKVLGESIVEIKDNSELIKQFIKSNPKYLPAYVELGEIDKVMKLDPNFLIRQ